ncbi:MULTISPECIES: hypothetical protein [Bacillus]|uniref:hypothetical protein n=1 Tax=Bacillus TaxID=1386 RepID=UPI001581D494|nr:hypothetical protein [Bacillus glycinifermentans]MBU8785835.1 hypothetical protein [Bacillus glycinifermentans]NUJ15629.1 hypothetical protein [Bacillus glycinifermentans]
MNRDTIINQVNVYQISVNSIDTSSGIFVGTNYAHNWSSHRKNNYGFGSISNSQISNNYSYVTDNDIVDTPIQNQPNILLGPKEGNVNEVDIGEINVNVIDTCAAISVGENEVNGWSAHSKRIAGQGRFTGTVQNSQNTTLVIDNDDNDCQINDFH